METLTKVPFLAIILGDKETTEADIAELRRLYSNELQDGEEFEVVHYPRYHRYGYQPSSNDEAVRRQVGRGTQQVIVLIPRGCNYTEGACRLQAFAQRGTQVRTFFRP